MSDHVNNSMRAHSTGMRFLAERRALADDCVDRLCSSKHVHRQWNMHADLLANMDLTGFVAAMASVVPGGRFIRLAVPPALANLAPLIVWKANISTYSALHAS